MIVYTYGPPGSGKTTIGRELASQLNYSYLDLDDEIQKQAGKPIPEIFAADGEAGFRGLEFKVLRQVVTPTIAGSKNLVLALGGGALLDPANRVFVESHGRVLFMDVPVELLLHRLTRTATQRPLLAESVEERLSLLLARRSDHYASFTNRIDASLPVQQAAWQAQVILGVFRVTGMGPDYEVRVIPGGLPEIGDMLRPHQADGRVALVCDETVAGLHAAAVVGSLEAAGYLVHSIVIPPGEANKTISTVNSLWDGFLRAGIERGSTVLALGGGVVGDLAGFAAATYLRGVRWACLPTTLLAMVDASLGGKTGADLPQGKNLVGAFHAPAFVLADPQVLDTLPEIELRSGLAEVVKHGVIADPTLFAICAQGWNAVHAQRDEIIRRAIAVKVQVIKEDPFEGGRRAALNLGHTLGHAVEQASGFQLKHGEAVAIGTLFAARLSRSLGLAEVGVPEAITEVLNGLGLPVEIPSWIGREQIRQAMGFDKKKASGRLRWVLPVRIGEVLVGVDVDDPLHILPG